MATQVINGILVPEVNTKATKRAFQNRFPRLANGISTKWDAMTRFLDGDGYAASLGVTGAALEDLRMLIATGVNRLNASPYVEMVAGGEAANMTYLLTQISSALPFALTMGERAQIMEPPLADFEQYGG